MGESKPRRYAQVMYTCRHSNTYYTACIALSRVYNCIGSIQTTQCSFMSCITEHGLHTSEHGLHTTEHGLHTTEHG